MKFAFPFALIALAACTPGNPDGRVENPGVGFGSYDNYQQERSARDAQLEATQPLVTGPQISSEEVAPAETVEETPVVTTNNPDISDENSFQAVSERETIESDAERLAAQREAYQVIEPTDLPERPANERPNIVQYALGTHHPVGQKIWDRPNSTSQARFERACARYPSPDLAQEDFLAMGGPRSDRKGMDPDGDGYACDWDPTPFRAAQSAKN